MQKLSATVRDHITTFLIGDIWRDLNKIAELLKDNKNQFPLKKKLITDKSTIDIIECITNLKLISKKMSGSKFSLNQKLIVYVYLINYSKYYVDFYLACKELSSYKRSTWGMLIQVSGFNLIQKEGVSNVRNLDGYPSLNLVRMDVYEAQFYKYYNTHIPESAIAHYLDNYNSDERNKKYSDRDMTNFNEYYFLCDAYSCNFWRPTEAYTLAIRKSIFIHECRAGKHDRYFCADESLPIISLCYLMDSLYYCVQKSIDPYFDAHNVGNDNEMEYW